MIIPKHGKGFYAADLQAAGHPQVLVIIDKFSVYKQILFNSFAQAIGDKAEVTIVNHNQSLDLLEYYLNNYLDHFDYYVVTPHFPLDDASQARARKQLSRIPNRKLIMLDRLLPNYPGNFGAVYQDFENDIYSGLLQGLEILRLKNRLRVITLPSSLYGQKIHKGESHDYSGHYAIDLINKGTITINPAMSDFSNVTYKLVKLDFKGDGMAEGRYDLFCWDLGL